MIFHSLVFLLGEANNFSLLDFNKPLTLDWTDGPSCAMKSIYSSPDIDAQSVNQKIRQ